MLDEGQGVGGGDGGILDALPDLVDLQQLQPQEFQVICLNSKSNMYFLTLLAFSCEISLCLIITNCSALHEVIKTAE